MASAFDFIKQLNDARRFALADPALYNQVLPGVLGAIGTGAALPLRRWGADFLAECFGSPAVSADEKIRLAIQQFPAKEGEPAHGVLETIKEYLEKETDADILKGAVVCAASLYPLVVRWM
jgi:symplekin